MPFQVLCFLSCVSPSLDNQPVNNDSSLDTTTLPEAKEYNTAIHFLHLSPKGFWGAISPSLLIHSNRRDKI